MHKMIMDERKMYYKFFYHSSTINSKLFIALPLADHKPECKLMCAMPNNNININIQTCPVFMCTLTINNFETNGGQP